jgi:hypothetical protein
MRTVRIAALVSALSALAACSQPAWKPYQNAAWGFGVSFRGDPKVTETPASPGSLKSLQAEAKSGGRDYVISVTDATASGKTPDQLLAQAPQATADGEGGTLTSTANVQSGGLAGREFVVTRQGQPLERDRIFVSGGRFYQLVTQSPYGAKDKETQTFLESFHLGG